MISRSASKSTAPKLAAEFPARARYEDDCGERGPIKERSEQIGDEWKNGRRERS